MIQSDIIITIFSEFDTPEFIDYSKDVFKNLMDGTKLYSLSRLYTECAKEGKTGRCGSPWKLHFFIYWLSAEIGEFWKWKNFETALYGKARLSSMHAEIVKNITKKLSCDPDLERYFKGKKFWEADIHEIIFKYQVERKALVERKKFETQKISDVTAVSKKTIESARQIIEPIRQYLELKYDVIYGHIKKEGVVIQGEMRRGENRFRKIDRKLFDQIILELEEEGLISIKKPDKKIYLISMKK